MIASLYQAQAADLSGIWGAAIVAIVFGAIALAFGVYQSQRGVPAGQRQALETMTERISEQTVVINALQRQVQAQWLHSDGQDKQLLELRARNLHLEQLTTDQAAIIVALQRQLAGLASGNRRTGKRLREVLASRLNETELREWASDLGISFESLEGANLRALVLSMLDTLERYGRLEEGLNELRRIRPDIPLDGAQ